MLPVRLLATSYIAVSAVGAIHSLRRRRPARLLGVGLPGPPIAQAISIGTPLSAPPAMLVALAIAADRRRDRALLALSAMFLLGITGEPDTYRAIRRPRADPIATVCVALAVAIPAAMALTAVRSCWFEALTGGDLLRAERYANHAGQHSRYSYTATATVVSV